MPQEEIVAGASWRSPSSLAAAAGCRCGKRRLVLVERQPLGDDDVIASPEQVDKAGFERHAPGEMGGMTGAAQQTLHPGRPLVQWMKPLREKTDTDMVHRHLFNKIRYIVRVRVADVRFYEAVGERHRRHSGTTW
jgi:hypothetical protein